jgi:hypothetical protein
MCFFISDKSDLFIISKAFSKGFASILQEKCNSLAICFLNNCALPILIVNSVKKYQILFNFCPTIE